MWRTFAENCWYIHARELTGSSRIKSAIKLSP
jgi:hypothetical protein